MKAAALSRLESQQSSIAKKVLTFVPYDQVVNAAQVANRMKPAGLSPSIDVIRGCLGNLAHVGLLKEPDRGFYIRISPKDSPTASASVQVRPNGSDFVAAIATQTQQAVDATVPPQPKPIEQQGEDMIARFANITSDMRANGKELIEMADELDDFVTSLSSQLDNLNRLKKMLKDFQ